MKTISVLTFLVVLSVLIVVSCNFRNEDSGKTVIFMEAQKQSMRHRSYYMHLINSPDSVEFYKIKMDSVTLLYDHAIAEYYK